jgi:glycosyltransferase involved in cell wall biosynthesis
MNIFLYYYRLLDYDGNRPTLGGVQTYLTNLIDLFVSMDWNVTLFQKSNHEFIKNWREVTVVGVPAINQRKIRNQVLSLLKISKKFEKGDTIKIFGADHFSVKMHDPKSILIQHGVSWDIPIKNPTLSNRLYRLNELVRAKHNFENCHNRVCVDYNFLNWYRTVSLHDDSNIWVVPNFCKPAEQDEITKNRSMSLQRPVRILFSRRFFDYRGTRLFANVVRKLLEANHPIEVTFAGEGPDTEYLQAFFVNQDKIKISQYAFGEEMPIHLCHEIAVIPSLGSEGTSLSVAEAMAAGCCVVATNVGGITNMVIDNFNGRLIMPNEEELFKTLEYLIQNPGERERMGMNAWKTATSSFSHERWSNKWKEIIDFVAA